jgi:hypothetical protein
MTKHVKDLLSSYVLCDKLITYVKDEGGKLLTKNFGHLETIEI